MRCGVRGGVAGRWWPMWIMRGRGSVKLGLQQGGTDHASYEELVLYCGALPNIVKGLSRAGCPEWDS